MGRPAPGLWTCAPTMLTPLGDNDLRRGYGSCPSTYPKVSDIWDDAWLMDAHGTGAPDDLLNRARLARSGHFAHQLHS